MGHPDPPRTPAQVAVVAAISAAIPVPHGRSLVVGITGVDGAGKTVLATHLHQQLLALGRPSAVIHLDDFHHPRTVRHQLPDRAESYIRHAFDLETAASQVLAPLRATGSLCCTLDLLDLPSDTRSLRRTYAIHPGTVVILEGVLLFRPPIDAFLDIRVLVDIEPALMVARLLARDGGSPLEAARTYHDKLLPVRTWFWRTQLPHERADVIVDNTDVLMPRLLRTSRPGLARR